MTTINVDVRIGGGQPPSSGGRGKSYVLYAPRAVVNTSAGKTIVPVPDRVELDPASGTATVTLDALPAETPYVFQFEVDNGYWKSSEIVAIVPASGTHKLADLVVLGDDFTPPAWYSKVLTAQQVVEDAAAEVPTLVAAAVDQDIDGRDLVEVTKTYPGDVAGGFMGENGRATDLVFDPQGQVTEGALDRWADRLLARMIARGLLGGGIDGYGSTAAGGFVGDNGRETDFVFDASGAALQSVLNRWADRMASRLAAVIPGIPAAPGVLDSAFIGSRLLRRVTAAGLLELVVSEAARLAAWGDSLTDGWPLPPFLADQSNAWPAVFDAGWSGTVHNGGKAGQSADEIALRQGGLVLTFDAFTIPASGAVNVTARETIGWRLDRAWSCVGTIDGVAGTLSRPVGSTITFTRTASGEAKPVAAGAVFISTPGEQQKDAVQVLFAGRNDIGYSSPAGDVAKRVIAAHIAMMERPGAAHPRRLTVGTITNTGETRGSAGHTVVTAINSTLAALYPHHYFDLRAYLVNECIYDLGITPTATDLARIQADTLPPSIMANYNSADGTHDGTHYSPATAAAVAAKLKAVLTAKGWLS